MSTLAIMVARIQDELARSDLESQVRYAISDAIKAYQDERWWFSESRDLTLTTVASQEFYDSDDLAAIATLTKIDYLTCYVGNQPFQLLPMAPADIEWATQNGTSTGQPSWYAFYNRQFRFYPIPDAAYTVRIAGTVTVDEPATDAEANNSWMTHAERLIRSRAKMELALHVLKDTELAAVMQQAVTEAEDQLRGRTAILTQIGEGSVKGMAF